MISVNMGKYPSPFVYWAQSDSHVYLKVDLKASTEVRYGNVKTNLFR